MGKIRAKIAKKRFWELDLLRGIFVLLMIFDHFMFSCSYMLPSFNTIFNQTGFWQGLTDFADYYWHYPPKEVVHYIAIAVFMLLCGISCTLSRSNFRRGFIALLAAIVITIVTSILEDMFLFTGLTIRFGVIHMLGSSMIIYAFLQIPLKTLSAPISKLKLSKNATANTIEWVLRLLPAMVGILFLALFFGLKWGQFVFILNDYNQEYLHLSTNINLDLQRGKFYKDLMSIIIMPKNYKNLYGADYFPILPYGALVLAGGLIGETIYKIKKRTTFNPKITAPITFVGRHALIIYLVHQAVIAGVLFICVAIRSMF